MDLPCPFSVYKLKQFCGDNTLICRNRLGKGGVEGEMRPGEGTTDLKSAPNSPVVNTASFLSTVQPGPGHQELYQVCDGGKSC